MENFQKVLRRGSHFGEASGRILLPEFDGILGRPDVVDAHILALPCAVGLDVLATSLGSPASAHILSILRYGAPRSMSHLEKVTGLSNRSLVSYTRRLEDAGIVNVHTNSTFSLACPLPSSPSSMVDIVAYEGKLSNWRRALHQAIGYRSFSHSVRVVMPASSARRAKQIEDTFRVNGIGLIAIEEDGSEHVLISSKKRRPASRRLYLLAVGTVLKRFIEERRSSDLQIRPEYFHCI